MASVGLVFGMMGMTFGIIASSRTNVLRRDFEALKKRIEDSGVVKE